MRRYHITVDGRAFAIDVDDVGHERWRVDVGGRAFDVTLDGAEELAVTPEAPQAVAAPAALPAAAANAPRPVNRPAARPAADVPAGGTASARPATNGGTDALAAPMPGVILRIAVAPGAEVKRGQDIAVLEAMKMENILRSPRDGRIAEVCVQVGQQVAHGQAVVRYAAGAPASSAGAAA